ncbi:MAG TPA: hypothetical protein VK162_11225 [Streptosporangiaceae bacterium]|nr:hypothetical protein [Streptosporangiaceae bacterium]
MVMLVAPSATASSFVHQVVPAQPVVRAAAGLAVARDSEAAVR